MSAKTSALIVSAVVRDGRITVVDDFAYRTLATRRAKQWGEGRALQIRIEPEEDAKTYGDVKYWWGYVVEPLVRYTGDPEWHLYLKAMFLPEGKTSLTQLSHEEMRLVIDKSEVWARTVCPEAYELHGREYVA